MTGRMWGGGRLWATLAVVMSLLLVVVLPTQAQSDTRFFTETGHSLRGAFRFFWEANGALDTFGYPITEEFRDADGTLVQWFERARFAYSEVGGLPVVTLGNLGVEVTQGRVFPKSPPLAQDTADMRYIPQTQHVLMYGFKTTWETRGAERIFGYPISDELPEILDDGMWHTVQYFEKARFEYWPDFAPGQRVRLSLLGRRLAPPDRMAPVPSGGTPTPTPVAPTVPAPVPPGVNGQATPEHGPPGTTFTFAATGFTPGEHIGIWLTAPSQATVGLPQQATADSQGSLATAQISITSGLNFPEGLYSFNAQGVRSKHEARAFFRVTTLATQGDPQKLGRLIHDQLPRQGQALIMPLAAPPGYTFFLVGAGFQSDELVSAWVTGPDKQSHAIDPALIEVSGGSAQVLVNTDGLPTGVYLAVLQGQRSKVIAAASFMLTRDFVAGPGTARPANANGSATPADAVPGSLVQVRGQGLQAGEPVEVWMTDPMGSYVLLPDPLTAERDGRIGYSPAIDLDVPSDILAGVYGMHFRGLQSKVRVDVYFTVTQPTP